MGGSASKKSNFPGMTMTQEQIDKIYQNFVQFSKLEDGKSGEHIGEKFLSKHLKPNKQFGRNLHSFLASQSLTQTLNFDVFLYFVEFFFQTSSYLRQDVRYREYSVLEIMCIISLYSNSYKNKLTDKEYIQRLPVTYRQGFEMMKYLHAMIGLMNGKKSLKIIAEKDETLPKNIANQIFGQSYEMTFRNFVEKTLAVVPNIEKIIQNYVKHVFYVNKQIEKKKADPNQPKVVHHKFSQALNHNAYSNMSMFVSEFTDSCQYRERVYSGKDQNFDYSELGSALALANNFNVLLLVSHLNDRRPVDDDADIIQKSVASALSDKEQQTVGLLLPKKKVENASFFQLLPDFTVVKNKGKSSFFGIDQSAAVILFGDDEEDIFFLHKEIVKESYIRTKNPNFVQCGVQPTSLKIDQVEVWVLSDTPIDLNTLNNPTQAQQKQSVTSERVMVEQKTTTTTSYQVVN